MTQLITTSQNGCGWDIKGQKTRTPGPTSWALASQSGDLCV
jgi:hypothetical protein